jgi:glutamate synthase domain-containing protein 3
LEEIARSECVPDQDENAIDVDGLFHKIKRTKFSGFDGGLHVAMTRHHDDRCFDSLLFDFLKCGEAVFAGVGGERFAVRLSGASAVVEGTGDHGCEYMTGGTVVVLGKTGRNFAAGMSGGIAYVYDEDASFAKRCNTSMVTLEKLASSEEQQATLDRALWHRAKVDAEQQTDEAILKKLIEDHHRWTGSQRARFILDNWAEQRAKFVKVFPNEYRRALGELNAAKEAAQTIAQAKSPAAAKV